MLVSPSAHGARDIAHKKPTDKVLTASEELGLRLFLKHQVRFARVGWQASCKRVKVVKKMLLAPRFQRTLQVKGYVCFNTWEF